MQTGVCVCVCVCVCARAHVSVDAWVQTYDKCMNIMQMGLISALST